MTTIKPTFRRETKFSVEIQPMKQNTTPLYTTGAAPNGKPLVGGFFKMHDEVGYPIDCCIDEAKERGIEIDWLDAMCDCWLNDSLKFDSFVRQASQQVNQVDLAAGFTMAGAYVIRRFPKIKQSANPADVACRYILRKKQLGFKI